MNIIIGQKDRQIESSDLQRIIRKVKADGYGTKVHGYSAEAYSLDPLSWAIRIGLTEKTIGQLTDDDFSGESTSRVMSMLTRIAESLGYGKYYVRGTSPGVFDEELDGFWDIGHDTVSCRHDIFGGLPLTIDISKNQTVVEIYLDWINEYVLMHYPDAIPPSQNKFFMDEGVVSVFYSVHHLLTVRGLWVFKMANRELVNSNIVHIDQSIRRAVH